MNCSFGVTIGSINSYATKSISLINFGDTFFELINPDTKFIAFNKKLTIKKENPC